MNIPKPKTDTATGLKFYENYKDFSQYFETGYWADFFSGDKWIAGMPFILEADGRYYAKRTPPAPDKDCISIFARGMTIFVTRRE